MVGGKLVAMSNKSMRVANETASIIWISLNRGALMKMDSLSRSQKLSAKVVAVLNKRMQVANDKFAKRLSQAFASVDPASSAGLSADPIFSSTG
jgi:hypothetical protein